MTRDVSTSPTVTTGRRRFLTAMAWVSMICAVTVVIYVAVGRDSALFNVLGVVWLAGIAAGFVLLATYRGPQWAVPVFAVVQLLHPAAFVGLSYASVLLPVMGGGFFRAVLAPLLILALGSVAGLAALELRGPGAAHQSPSWVTFALLGLCGVVLAGLVVMTLHFIGVYRIPVFEYAYSFALTATATLLVAALAWRLGVRLTAPAARRVWRGAVATVAAFTAASYGVVLGSTMVAGMQNMGAASFATAAPSTHFSSPASLPMMLTGATYDTSVMRIEHEADWYDGPKTDVELGYDAYLPADAAEPTPVIIRLHGINAP